MSVPWPAEQLPELYPPGTAADMARRVAEWQADVLATLAKAPPGLSPAGRAAFLEGNGHRDRAGVSEANGHLYVYLPSSVAPELDVYFYPDLAPAG